MNRYVVDGALADMRAGKRVVIAAESVAHARHCFHEFADRAVEGETVRRANGQERIEHPSTGLILFRSVRGNALRGLTADVVYLDADASPEQMAEVLPVVASSGGEVIRR